MSEEATPMVEANATTSNIEIPSLLSPFLDDVTTAAPEMTLAVKQQKTRDAIAKLIKQGFVKINLMLMEGRALVKQNPYGLSKEEVYAGMPEAEVIAMWAFDETLKQMLNSARPGTVPDDPVPPTPTTPTTPTEPTNPEELPDSLKGSAG